MSMVAAKVPESSEIIPSKKGKAFILGALWVCNVGPVFKTRVACSLCPIEGPGGKRA